MKYPKIQSVYLRQQQKPRHLLEGQWSHDAFAYLATARWHLTEKVDGMNVRVAYENDHFVFKGRTDNARLPAYLLQRLYALFQPLTDDFASIYGPRKMTLFGEGFGGKIQNGHCYGPETDFVLFDIVVGENEWLPRECVEELANNFGLRIVPILGAATLPDAIAWVKRGIWSALGDCYAEGVVARPQLTLLDRHGDRVITKIKTKDFPKQP